MVGGLRPAIGWIWTWDHRPIMGPPTSEPPPEPAARSRQHGPSLGDPGWLGAATFLHLRCMEQDNDGGSSLGGGHAFVSVSGLARGEGSTRVHTCSCVPWEQGPAAVPGSSPPGV